MNFLLKNLRRYDFLLISIFSLLLRIAGIVELELLISIIIIIIIIITIIIITIITLIINLMNAGPAGHIQSILDRRVRQSQSHLRIIVTLTGSSSTPLLHISLLKGTFQDSLANLCNDKRD